MKKYAYYFTPNEIRLLSNALAKLNYDKDSDLDIDTYYKKITELQDKLLRGIA